MNPAQQETRNLCVNGTYKEIITRTFPIVIAFSIPQLNYLINSIFISQIDTFYLGTGAIVSIYYLIFSIIGIGFNNGIQIVIAYYAGKNDSEKIRQAFFNGCLWAVILSVICVFFTLFLAHSIFYGMLNDTIMVEKATDFIRIRIIGLPFLYLYLLRNALYINYNSTKTLIYFSLVEAFFNILLDYGLIFGNIGMPALGFNGTAYASVIAEIIGFLAVVIQLHFYPLDRHNKITYQFEFNKKISKKILKTTLPIALQMALSVISWQIFFFFVANRGTNFLATSNIIRNVFSLTNIYNWGLGNTTNSMISNLYGQARSGELFPFIKKLLIVSISGTLFIMLVFYFLEPFIIGLFTTEKEILSLIKNPYLLIITGLNLWGISSVFFNSILPLQTWRFIIFIEVFSIILYLIYAYYTTQIYRLSLTWIWNAEIIYTISTGGLSLYALCQWLKKYKLCAK